MHWTCRFLDVRKIGDFSPWDEGRKYFMTLTRYNTGVEPTTSNIKFSQHRGLPDYDNRVSATVEKTKLLRNRF